MAHTEEDFARAAKALEDRLNKLDPDTVEVDDTSDLRSIAEAVDSARSAEAQIRERVEVARAHGRSWNRIALALGVSRQAARERFVDKMTAGSSQ